MNQEQLSGLERNELEAVYFKVCNVKRTLLTSGNLTRKPSDFVIKEILQAIADPRIPAARSMTWEQMVAEYAKYGINEEYLLCGNRHPAVLLDRQEMLVDNYRSDLKTLEEKKPKTVVEIESVIDAVLEDAAAETGIEVTRLLLKLLKYIVLSKSHQSVNFLRKELSEYLDLAKLGL